MSFSIGETLRGAGSTVWSIGSSAASGLSRGVINGRQVGVIPVVGAVGVALVILCLLARRYLFPKTKELPPLPPQPQVKQVYHSKGPLSVEVSADQSIYPDQNSLTHSPDLESLLHVFDPDSEVPEPIEIANSSNSDFSTSSLTATSENISTTSVPANFAIVDLTNEKNQPQVMKLLKWQLSGETVTIRIDRSWIKMSGKTVSALEAVGKHHLDRRSSLQDITIHAVTLMTMAGAEKYGYKEAGYGFIARNAKDAYLIRIPEGGEFTLPTRTSTQTEKVKAIMELFEQLSNQVQKDVILTLPSINSENCVQEIACRLDAVYLIKDENHQIRSLRLKIKQDSEDPQEVTIPLNRLHQCSIKQLSSV